MAAKQSLFVPIGISVLLIVGYYLLAPWHPQLMLQAPQFYQGAWWQLVTAQLLHHNPPHLWFNLAGLWILWLLFPQQFRRNQDWWVVLPIGIASSLFEVLLSPVSLTYAGFSGALYGLYFYAAGKDAVNKQWIGMLVLVGLALKLGWDFMYPSETVQLAVFAHLGGVVAAMVLILLEQYRQPSA